MLQLDQFEIILASQSPRRSELLRLAGLPFVVKATGVEENYPPTMPLEEVPVFLAKKKARAAREFIAKNHQVVLAADSVVIINDKILEKPGNKTEAQGMLTKLSGQTHTVITGVCLLTKNREIAFGDATQVTFATLSSTEINYYIDTYSPYDKAGSYAIQEWIGLCKIEKIEGTYANVMGLPVQRVWQSLEEIFR